MYKLLCLLILLISAGCNEDSVDETIIDANQITTLPFFINPSVFPIEKGTEAMYKFIYNNISYPPLARENNIMGQVTHSFTILSDGSTKDFELVNGIGYGCNEECLRVLQLMEWLPARKDDKAISMRFTLPLKFVL